MKKRYDDGGEVDYVDDSDLSDEVERTTYAGGVKSTTNEAPKATPVKKATPVAKKASAPKSKASDEYATAARNKYAEARGYDEASKNKNLSSEDRRAMLGRYTQAMRDYDTLGRASAGAKAKGMKAGGAVSASRRGDGIAQRGKTRGRVL